MVHNFFDKKTSGGAIKSEIKQNGELTKELHKPIIRKFEKRKVHSSFKDNVCGAYLADMQLISNWFRFLLDVTDIYQKYSLIIFLKDKKRIIITNAFQRFIDESKRKPNKIWVYKDKKFYNKSMKLL